tara:strand:- start:48 stop:194 length:147 start_codon:yes stop_codon:yes gene_type:complete
MSKAGWVEKSVLGGPLSSKKPRKMLNGAERNEDTKKIHKGWAGRIFWH